MQCNGACIDVCIDTCESKRGHVYKRAYIWTRAYAHDCRRAFFHDVSRLMSTRAIPDATLDLPFGPRSLPPGHSSAPLLGVLILAACAVRAGALIGLTSHTHRAFSARVRRRGWIVCQRLESLFVYLCFFICAVACVHVSASVCRKGVVPQTSIDGHASPDAQSGRPEE